MKPKYKVGDIVTIKKKREGSKSDYRFSFTDDMLEKYGGKSYRIREISDGSYASKGSIPDDEHRYELEGTSCFAWSSSMFEESSEALPLDISTDNSLDAFIAKKKCPELDFTL